MERKSNKHIMVELGDVECLLSVLDRGEQHTENEVHHFKRVFYSKQMT